MGRGFESHPPYHGKIAGQRPLASPKSIGKMSDSILLRRCYEALDPRWCASTLFRVRPSTFHARRAKPAQMTAKTKKK